MKQWFFKITDYADALLDEIPALDWPEKIKTAQTNWIGRSEGAEIQFAIDGRDDILTVFTTRPDTLSVSYTHLDVYKRQVSGALRLLMTPTTRAPLRLRRHSKRSIALLMPVSALQYWGTCASLVRRASQLMKRLATCVIRACYRGSCWWGQSARSTLRQRPERVAVRCTLRAMR